MATRVLQGFSCRLKKERITSCRLSCSCTLPWKHIRHLTNLWPPLPGMSSNLPCFLNLAYKTHKKYPEPVHTQTSNNYSKLFVRTCFPSFGSAIRYLRGAIYHLNIEAREKNESGRLQSSFALLELLLQSILRPHLPYQYRTPISTRVPFSHRRLLPRAYIFALYHPSHLSPSLITQSLPSSKPCHRWTSPSAPILAILLLPFLRPFSLIP